MRCLGALDLKLENISLGRRPSRAALVDGPAGGAEAIAIQRGMPWQGSGRFCKEADHLAIGILHPWFQIRFEEMTGLVECLHDVVSRELAENTKGKLSAEVFRSKKDKFGLIEIGRASCRERACKYV